MAVPAIWRVMIRLQVLWNAVGSTRLRVQRLGDLANLTTGDLSLAVGAVARIERDLLLLLEAHVEGIEASRSARRARRDEERRARQCKSVVAAQSSEFPTWLGGARSPR